MRKHQSWPRKSAMDWCVAQKVFLSCLRMVFRSSNSISEQLESLCIVISESLTRERWRFILTIVNLQQIQCISFLTVRRNFDYIWLWSPFIIVVILANVMAFHFLQTRWRNSFVNDLKSKKFLRLTTLLGLILMTGLCLNMLEGREMARFHKEMSIDLNFQSNKYGGI